MGTNAVKVPALEYHNVSVAYGDSLVLTDVDFSIPIGSIVGVLGPNGAGKSTLLKAAIGLVPRCSGWIKFLGQDFSRYRNHIAYVPQRESVAWDFPATVLDVVLMGMFHEIPWWKKINKEQTARALMALDRMGMTAFKDRPLQNLSGGQQQRVFLARALVQNPLFLFLDEPLAGIDVDTEEIVMKTLKDLAKTGTTILVVHHDLSTVEQYFDRVLMVNARLICDGPTNLVFRPEAVKTTYGPRLVIHEEARQASKPLANYREDL